MPLPVRLANLSVWQRTVRDHPLLSTNEDSKTPLPQDTDIVIIGGGLCGALVAHALLYPEEHGHPPSTSTPRITLLEARELASGATGRNAGHCRPDAARGFPTFAALHGPQGAREILESEREVLRRADAFIKRHDIKCEWNPRTTYDVFLSAEFASHTATAVEAYKAAGGKPDLQTLSPAEAGEVFPTSSHGAAAWPAATLNPAQLALGVLELCTRTPLFQAYAHTPVLGVERDGEGWAVSTARGGVRARQVVFATNAYGGHALEGLIAPVVAQAHKLAPGRPLAGSYSLRQSPEVFYSVAPRPDNSVVLGSSLGSGPSFTGVDDSAYDPARARAAAKAWQALLPGDRVHIEQQDGLDEASKVAGTRDVADHIPGVQGLEYAWNGIIGFTPDMVPLVGDVVGMPGQYLAAGYCGHGMARMFVTAPALAHYIRTGEWDTAMPACFRVTPERVARLRGMEMPAVVRRSTRQSKL